MPVCLRAGGRLVARRGCLKGGSYYALDPLIYVANKGRAFEEFYRVLKPGGRLSIWEPSNRFGRPNLPSDGRLFAGYDTAPVQDLDRRVRAVFEGLQPPDTDPMLDFDESDLLDSAESAGFGEIYLNSEVKIAPYAASEDDIVCDWESFAKIPGNNPPRVNLSAPASSGGIDSTSTFIATKLSPMRKAARIRVLLPPVVCPFPSRSSAAPKR